MKMEWKKMTAAEKRWTVLVWIYVAIALVFSTLDLSGMWKNEIFKYMIAVFFLVEGVVEWKKNWKISLLNFVIAVIFLFEAFSF